MAFIKNTPNRKCIKCNNKKPLNEFKENLKSYKGYDYTCLECYLRPRIQKTHRVCYKCKEEKTLEEFKNRTANVLGKDYICKKCHNTLKSKNKGKRKKSDKTKRRCYNCKETKNIEEFVKRLKNKSGYSYLCKICKSNQKKELEKRKDPKIPSWVIRLRKNISKRKKWKIGGMVSSNYLISLYTKQQGKCYFSGIDLDISEGREKNLRQISIDRLDSRLGYIDGNVVLCCFGLNLCKSDFDLKDFIKFLKEIREIK